MVVFSVPPRWHRRGIPVWAPCPVGGGVSVPRRNLLGLLLLLQQWDNRLPRHEALKGQYTHTHTGSAWSFRSHGQRPRSALIYPLTVNLAGSPLSDDTYMCYPALAARREGTGANFEDMARQRRLSTKGSSVSMRPTRTVPKAHTSEQKCIHGKKLPPFKKEKRRQDASPH